MSEPLTMTAEQEAEDRRGYDKVLPSGFVHVPPHVATVRVWAEVDALRAALSRARAPQHETTMGRLNREYGEEQAAAPPALSHALEAGEMPTTANRWYFHPASPAARPEIAEREVVQVVAAVRRRDGKFWCCCRSADGEHGGLNGMWEYPGGKVEAGESLEDALRREMREEFGAEVRIKGQIDAIPAEGFGKRYNVTFFDVDFIDEPILRVHSEAHWFTVSGLLLQSHLPSGTEFNRRLCNYAMILSAVSRSPAAPEAAKTPDVSPFKRVESAPHCRIYELHDTPTQRTAVRIYHEKDVSIAQSDEDGEDSICVGIPLDALRAMLAAAPEATQENKE